MMTQADGTKDDDLEAAAGAGADDDAELADLAQLNPEVFAEAPDGLDVDGIMPLPGELTGRASGTDEDLVALFDNDTDEHLTDGFSGGSDDEPPVKIR